MALVVGTRFMKRAVMHPSGQENAPDCDQGLAMPWGIFPGAANSFPSLEHSTPLDSPFYGTSKVALSLPLVE